MCRARTLSLVATGFWPVRVLKTTQSHKPCYTSAFACVRAGMAWS